MFNNMTKQLIKEILESNQTSLLFFHGDHCGHCKQIRPSVQEFGKSKNYNYLEVESGDENIDNLFKIAYLPTVIIIKEGKYTRYEGTNKINQLINKQ